MAKLIKGLTIQIGAETTKLDKALKDSEARTRSACSELRQINNILKTNGDSAEMWRQKQTVLTQALEASRDKLKVLHTAQKSIEDQLRDGDIDRGAYDAFRQKVEKANEKLDALKNQQTEIERQYRDGEIDKGAYDAFKRKLADAEKQVADLRIAENGLEESFRIGDISEEEYREFRRNIEQAEGNVRNFSNQLDEAQRQLDRTGDEADDAADDVQDLSEQAERAGNVGVNALSVALGNLLTEGLHKVKDGIKDVIKTGAEFESVISQVGAVSGASAEDIERLRSKAQDMGATTKFTAAQAGEAFNYMAMAGWKTEDMLGGISGILDLAAASGEDLGTTSDIVTDALTAFGLQASDSSHFADVLAAASSNANTNVSMMGETFKYVAPIAGSLNYSIEDTAEAIGLLANAGIKSSQAGTTLRSIITRLSTDAGASSTKLGALGILTTKLGVEFYDSSGKAREFGDVIADAREAWGGLSDEEQTSYGKMIAGQEAISGWLALMNASTDDVNKLSGAINNCDGAASDMSKTMQDNLQGDMTLLGSAVDGMKISLSDKLEPEIREIVQYTTKKMPEIEDALGKVFKIGSKVVDGAIKVLPTAVDVAETAVPVIAAIGTGIGALKVAQQAQDWIKGLNAVISANPYAAAATALLAVSTAAFEVYKHYAEAPTALDEINAKYEKQYEDIERVSQSMSDMKNSFNERAGDIQSETTRTEELWKELDALADATGRVKDSDKERAQYILGELNDALGTEYTMTDNMINKYKDMEAEIDELIRKKQASLLLDSYAENVDAYRTAQRESEAAYIEADLQKQTYKDEMDSILAEWEKYYNETYGGTDKYKAGTTMQEFADKYMWHIKDSDGRYVTWYNYSHEADLYNRYLDAQANANNLGGQAKKEKENYKQATAAIEKYNAALTDFTKGNYDAVVQDLYGVQNQYLQIIETESDLAKRQQAYYDGMEELGSKLKLTLYSNSQQAVNEALDAIGELASKAALAEIEISEFMSDEIKEKLQTMLDSGFDITRLAEWFAESGIKTGDVFNGKYVDIVQKQLDAGYDISSLLTWGMNSGSLTGDEFMKFYNENCQNGFDATFSDGGLDISAMLKWAEESGKSIGEILGYNTSQRMSEYMNWLYSEGMKVPKSIQSASDAQMYANGNYNIGFYANGGTLREGMGIFAEDGPELFEIKNGEAKITPLSDKAKYHPVDSALAAMLSSENAYNQPQIGTDLIGIMSGGVLSAQNSAGSGSAASESSGKKLIYNSYNINATISNDYDVSRLAERLAIEQRRTEEGKGY